MRGHPGERARETEENFNAKKQSSKAGQGEIRRAIYACITFVFSSFNKNPVEYKYPHKRLFRLVYTHKLEYSHVIKQ